MSEMKAAMKHRLTDIKDRPVVDEGWKGGLGLWC